MLNRGSQASLMGNVEFLAELEKFDATPNHHERVLSANESHDVDGVMWVARPRFEEPEGPPAPESSAGRIALSVTGFLLMMCLGGAAALFVFHDRVAQLFR